VALEGRRGRLGVVAWLTGDTAPGLARSSSDGDCDAVAKRSRPDGCRRGGCRRWADPCPPMAKG